MSKVRDIMTPIQKLVYLDASDTVEEAYQIMAERNIHSVLVKSFGSNFPRIFEEQDLRYIWSQKLNTSQITLEDYARVIEYRADPNWTCEELRSYFGFSSHLLVCDEYGSVLGLVSTNDLKKCK